MSIWIRIEAGTAILSHSAHAEHVALRTAMIEARGALLIWDAASEERFPDAEIHSTNEAAGWLADVYGAGIAAAVVENTAATIPLPEDAELVDAAHHLAWLTWASDWWPAGVYTPALDPSILAAESAIAAHDVEHLLDDEDAVERALQQAIDAPAALAAAPQRVKEDAAALLDALTALADDYGIVLSPAHVQSARAEWALAAGTSAHLSEGVEIGHGITPVRWADVPAQTVAADSDAQWSLRHVDGVPHLHVVVAAVPGAVTHSADAALWARFGPETLDIDVPLRGNGTAFTGSMQVAASTALLPVEERTLWVRDPRLAPVPGPAESEEARDAVRSHAVSRLDAPEASLSVRAAEE